MCLCACECVRVHVNVCVCVCTCVCTYATLSNPKGTLAEGGEREPCDSTTHFSDSVTRFDEVSVAKGALGRFQVGLCLRVFVYRCVCVCVRVRVCVCAGVSPLLLFPVDVFGYFAGARATLYSACPVSASYAFEYTYICIYQCICVYT